MLTSLVLGVGMSICANEIRQEATQLYRASNTAVEKSLVMEPGIDSIAKSELKSAIELVSKRSENVRDKLAKLKAGIMQKESSDQTEINKMLDDINVAFSMISGMALYLKEEFESSKIQDEDVKAYDRQMLRSVVLVRNDIENLLSLLKQMQPHEVLDAEPLFASRSEVLEVMIKGMVRQGYSEQVAKDMVH
ncbi:MAG: hypothetical protein WBH20_14720 [Oceanisphaera sp.]|uniref:hypothetical protein n=1 Tax=Oceanisphaera sp. TaxID=1929979 RepID=UPI003C73567F